jgi:hypothetical protein
MSKTNTKTNTKKTASKTDVKVEKQVHDKQIMTAAIDFTTLKRMYPKRFLAEILATEGYVEDGNKYKKL